MMLPNPEGPASHLRWYAVQTKSRQEDRAEANLTSLGVETFLPKTRRSRTSCYSDGRRSRFEPLFPRYLFVRCDGLPMAHLIRNTRGVTSLLGNESGPTPVDEEIVDLLRQRVDGDGFIEIVRSFKAGDAVRITAGPMRDLIGVFDARKGARERVAILLRTLNGYVRVVIDSHALQPS